MTERTTLQAIHNWGELRGYTQVPPRGPLPDEMALTLIRGYHACVSYTDRQIGRVLTALERLDLAKETIVVLWGDHGWNLGEHTLWCKHCNFDTSLRVPLILRVPGHRAGQRSRALVEFVDIYPTLCDLCGLSPPGHLESASLVPLLEDPDRPWKTAVFSRWIAGDSIRTDRYLYTEWQDAKSAVVARMLYDHQKDSEENRNVAVQSAQAERVRELSGRPQAGWRKALPPPRTSP